MDEIEKLEKYLIYGISLVIIKESKVLYESGEHGIKSLFTILHKNPEILKDSIVLDKRVGRAAALLLVKGGIDRLVTIKLSFSAKTVLDKNNIKHVQKETVPNILGRNSKKVCKLEEISRGKSPDEFVSYLDKYQIFE